MNTLKKAYEQLNLLTPLKTDCGKYCNSACCKADENTGMILLPNEETICDFGNIKSDADGNKIIVCDGECNRDKRPYSCRIFPLFPYTTQTENGVKIEVKTDPRATNICPLNDIKMIDKNFIRAVRRSAKILATDNEYLRFLTETTSLLKDIEYLRNILKL